MFIIYWKLKFKLNGLTYYPYGGGGGGGDSTAPPPVAPAPTAGEIAEANVNAAITQRPRAAQAEFDILSNPQFGVGATTQLFEDVRQDVFPREQEVRSQLVQNILANLISPTGASPDQQASVEAIRNREQGRLQQGIQRSANLGGGLFGGRRERREDEALTQFGQLNAEADIARDERGRLNALQSALPILQILFPELGLVSPQFSDPVPSANTALSGALQGRGQDVTARGQDVNLQQSELARQSALQSALFGAVGTAAGGALGGPLGAKIGGTVGSKIGGN